MLSGWTQCDNNSSYKREARGPESKKILQRKQRSECTIFRRKPQAKEHGQPLEAA